VVAVSRAGRALIALAGLLALGAGCSRAHSTECQEFCALAATCGILPSPLGLDLDNCTSQCELSDTTSFNTLSRCAMGVSLGDASGADLWCGGGGDGGGASPACGTFSGCVANSYPDADVIGEASLGLSLVPTPPFDYAAVIRQASDMSCGPVPTPVREMLLTASQCTKAGIESLTIFVEQSSVRQVASLTCSLSSPQQLVVPGLTPGLVRPIVDILAPFGAQAPGVTVCRRFYGPRVVLAANQQAGSLVPVPTDNDLFLGGDPCPDSAADGGVD
jgi:hypothetical protein